jgi:hypothetical protein
MNGRAEAETMRLADNGLNLVEVYSIAVWLIIVPVERSEGRST